MVKEASMCGAYMYLSEYIYTHNTTCLYCIDDDICAYICTLYTQFYTRARGVLLGEAQIKRDLFMSYAQVAPLQGTFEVKRGTATTSSPRPMAEGHTRHAVGIRAYLSVILCLAQTVPSTKGVPIVHQRK